MTELLYWHWIVFGIVLVLLEIALPSFTMLWFGAGAIIVGLLLVIFPAMSMTLQLLLWTGFSVVLTTLWFKFLKPLSTDKTKAGLSREAIVGETGQVMTAPDTDKRGRLRFPAPILGDDEWLFITEDNVAPGDRVRVIDVSGNSLIVCKHG